MAAWSIIRQARSRAGLSQRQLGAAAGKAQSEIARIESGRQDPSLGTLERLVEAAGFDLRIELVPHVDRGDWPSAATMAPSADEGAQALMAAIFKRAPDE